MDFSAYPAEVLAARLRFRHMKVLIALDEQGSMHRAASVLNMTQPGITKALREIESAVGATLFDRSRRGVTATPVGHCMVRYAYILYSELGQMSTEMSAIHGGHGGVIAMGAVQGAFPCVVVPAVSALRAAYPSLSLELKEGTSEMLMDQLGQGLLDLVVCRTTVVSDRSIFEYAELRQERICLVAGPGSPFAAAGVTQLRDLEACRWVLFPKRMPARRWLEREFMEEGLVPPACAIEASSTLVTLLMLREDPALVSMMSRELAVSFAAQGLLSIVPVPIRARGEPYELVLRKGFVPTQPMRSLILKLKRSAGVPSTASPPGSA